MRNHSRKICNRISLRAVEVLSTYLTDDIPASPQYQQLIVKRPINAATPILLARCRGCCGNFQSLHVHAELLVLGGREFKQSWDPLGPPHAPTPTISRVPNE